MQVGLADLNFVDEHMDRLDGDLPHPIPRLSSVSHEPYAEPGMSARLPRGTRVRFRHGCLVIDGPAWHPGT